jgi:hypothetical protein
MAVILKAAKKLLHTAASTGKTMITIPKRVRLGRDSNSRGQSPLD